MLAYATVNDLEARWRVLSDKERARAVVLLDDASVMLASTLEHAGVEIYDISDKRADAQRANMCAVVCSMVRRVMSVSEDLAGVTQASQTAGSYSLSTTYQNPAANLYITSAEKKALGIGRMRACAWRPKMRSADDTW